jgi:hypothetical protein
MFGLDGLQTDGRTGLETYAQLEYGSREAAWLRAGRAGHPARGGLRAWIGRIGRAGRRADGASAGSRATPAGPRSGWAEAVRPRDGCAHEALEFLGPGDRTRYFRCALCGTPVVVQDSRMWTIRATQPTDPAAPGGGEPRGRNATA